MIKRTLFSLLIGAGLIFGQVSALSAAETNTPGLPAEELTEESEATADSTLPTPGLPARATPVEATDSRLQQIEKQLTELTSAVEQVKRDSAHSFRFDPEYLLVTLIVLISVGGAVTVLFFILRFWYCVRKKRYEVDLRAVECGVWPGNEKTELPLATFIRRLFIWTLIGFVILVWIGLLNVGYMRFSPALLLWGAIVGGGYVVVYLFRLYLRYRDENR